MDGAPAHCSPVGASIDVALLWFDSSHFHDGAREVVFCAQAPHSCHRLPSVLSFLHPPATILSKGGQVGLFQELH